MLRYRALGPAAAGVAGRDGSVLVAHQAAPREADYDHRGCLDFVDNMIEPGVGHDPRPGAVLQSRWFLTPGMFGRIRVAGLAALRALLVPDTAIGTERFAGSC